MKKDKTNFYIAVCFLLFTLFAICGVAWTATNVEMNPYNKENLHPSTMHYLNKTNFKKNILTPDKLEDKINKGEPFFVLFFDPTCTACEDSLDEVVKNVKKEKVDLFLFNAHEFNEPLPFLNTEIYHYDYSIGYYSNGYYDYLYGDEQFDSIYTDWVKGFKNAIYGITL